MPWIRREDGFDAAMAAHHALNEIVRDRAIRPAEVTTIVAFAEELLPGDEEITEEEYDSFAGTMTEQNYEQVFIPHKEAELAELQTAQVAHAKVMADALTALGATTVAQKATVRAVIESDGYRRQRESLERAIPVLQAKIERDNAELGRVREDVGAGRSVRLRRRGQ